MYMMTAKSNETRRNWEQCKSTTLAGAKRECTKRFGNGHISDVLKIGVVEHTDDRERHDIQPIAAKTATENHWTSL